MRQSSWEMVWAAWYGGFLGLSVTFVEIGISDKMSWPFVTFEVVIALASLWATAGALRNFGKWVGRERAM